MKALTSAPNSRNATSRYPVLSHRPSQRPSIRLQTIYVPPFVHLLDFHTSSFALSRCSYLTLNVDLLSASLVSHTVFTS